MRRLSGYEAHHAFLGNLSQTDYTPSTKSFPVGKFKARFSDILAQVKAGEEIIITYGKKKERLAIIIPYPAYKSKGIKLGLLQDKPLTIHENFKMTEEDLLGS